MGSSLFQDSAVLLSKAQERLQVPDNASLKAFPAFVNGPAREQLAKAYATGSEMIEAATFKSVAFNTFAAIFGLVIARAIILVVYRLYFHPLAKYPGPKLAAATRLYEFWYQGIKITEYPEVIKEMHKTYGPIVRVGPEELSLNDSEFNVEYFSKDRKLDKDPWYYGFGFTNSLFTLLDKQKHKERQAHLAAHFTGKYFGNASPMMSQEIQDVVVKSFEENAEDGKPLNVSLTYRKVGNEILRTFLLGAGGNTTTSKDYAKDASTAYHPLFRAITYIRHFKWLYNVHHWIPNAIYERGLPMAKYSREAETNIRELVRDYDGAEEKDEALLYRLIEHDPSYRDNNAAAAVEEFMELLWGGREVMGHALTNISFHLMNKPECMKQLRAELLAAPFDLSTATYGQLQTLPYLYGVVKEGVRMQLGGGFRIPRINSEPVVYKDYVIPANTPISMCPNFFHDDPAVFKDPEDFKPERWSEPGADVLEHYWKPFGNGTRSCAGRNMALEVISRTVANVFSHYKIDFSGIDADYCRSEGMLKVFPHYSSTGLIVNVSRA